MTFNRSVQVWLCVSLSCLVAWWLSFERVLKVVGLHEVGMLNNRVVLYAHLSVALFIIVKIARALMYEDVNTFRDYIEWFAEPLDWSGLHKPTVAVIGAGPCGLSMSYALKHNNIEFDTFERNDAVGGNWYNGVYNVCGVYYSVV